MRSLLKTYERIGARKHAIENIRKPFIFEGCQPPLWQTPGRLQYYKVENEPFIPDEIKWEIRYPKRWAVSEENLRYEETV